ncbi:DNA-binding protein [Lentibacillus lipolyticus]|nr:DNA-binding protein [Lentibacillus lipolyticus]
MLKEESGMRQSHSLKAEKNVTVYGSLAAGDDLIEGILTECRKHGITSGKVSSIGSLKEVGYVLFETIDGQPTGYGKELSIDRPVELLNGSGFICLDEHGELDMHLHGMVVEEDGTIKAGHFLRGKNPALITVEFSITYGEDIEARRMLDQDLGFRVINFARK